MDFADIETPEHVVGKSLKVIIDDSSKLVRNGALTKWRNGYSMKTERYRITKWGQEGELGYELYDHNFDKNEINNLSSDTNYSLILDSLKKAIDLRIIDAKKKPKGIGRQFDGIKRTNKAPNITYGDFHRNDGKRSFLKN